MKYLCINNETNEVFSELDEEPHHQYRMTHKEVYPHGVTKIWYDMETKK